MRVERRLHGGAIVGPASRDAAAAQAWYVSRMNRGSSDQGKPPRSGVLLAVVGVVAGIVAGSAANIGTIFLGMQVLPPPEGVDPGDIASINAGIDRYSVAQLLVPLAAHAIGTLVGALVAATIASTRRSRLAAALVVGALSFVGGALVIRDIPNAPLWFGAADLVLAYFPMAWIGFLLATRIRGGDR